MKRIVIANFKMNQTPRETKEYLLSFLPKIKDSQALIGICFPFTSLAIASELCDGTKVQVGAQNMHFAEKGAYTGEISGKMLSSIGVNLVILGHSERRKIFGETNGTINQKIKTALANGLRVVFCYGETLYERNNHKTLIAIAKQIEEGLCGLYENELENIILAYEPVWAIGTNKTANEKQIAEVAAETKKIIAGMFSAEAAKKIQLLYGGSVTGKNAKQFFGVKDISGGLIGGASLDPDSFKEIINA